MDLWIAFVLASTIILIIPGPTIILVMSQSITHGPRSVIPLVSGVLLGDLTAMIFSLLGLGALLSASALFFTLFKMIGALYLIYLGIKMWVLRVENMTVQDRDGSKDTKSLFRSSFVVTALNPKSIAFFIAFFPQFIDHSQPVFSQLVLLGGTFLLLAGLNAALYGVFGGTMRDLIGKKSIRTWINRSGGTALIGAGIFTAALKRSG